MSLLPQQQWQAVSMPKHGPLGDCSSLVSVILLYARWCTAATVMCFILILTSTFMMGTCFDPCIAGRHCWHVLPLWISSMAASAHYAIHRTWAPPGVSAKLLPWGFGLCNMTWHG